MEQREVNRERLSWSERTVSTENTTRGPRPCHPSEAKCEVTVPPLRPPHKIKRPFPSKPTHSSFPQTQQNTHAHMFNRAVTASHPVCPGHITAKSLQAPDRATKVMRRDGVRERSFPPLNTVCPSEPPLLLLDRPGSRRDGAQGPSRSKAGAPLTAGSSPVRYQTEWRRYNACDSV